MLGNKSRLVEEGNMKSLFLFRESDAQKLMDEFEKLVMFWQLDLVYGEHFT